MQKDSSTNNNDVTTENVYTDPPPDGAPGEGNTHPYPPTCLPPHLLYTNPEMVRAAKRDSGLHLVENDLYQSGEKLARERYQNFDRTSGGISIVENDVYDSSRVTAQC